MKNWHSTFVIYFSVVISLISLIISTLKFIFYKIKFLGHPCGLKSTMLSRTHSRDTTCLVHKGVHYAVARAFA